MASARLGDPELKPFMDEMQRRLREEPDFAREFMQKAGLWTATGKVKKRYGG